MAKEFEDHLMNQYLDHVRFEKRLAERTVALYIEDLKKLSLLLTQSKLTALQVTSADIRRWLVLMNSTGRTPRGIALILSGWRGFYNWLGRQGHIKINPILGVKSPKVSKPLPKALSVDDAVRLAEYGGEKNTKDKYDESVHTNDPLDAHWYEARDAAIVELLYGSGLRVAELVGLDLKPSHHPNHKNAGWIDIDGSEAHVLGKGSKRRSVPVGAKTIEALKAWIHVRDLKLKTRDGFDSSEHSNALFIGHNATRLTPQSIWQRLRKRSLDAGLATPVHPHMLRHSFASHLLQSSSDLRGVQEMLGHANISTTQVYTRLDFQHLAKAYDAAHPRATKKTQKIKSTPKKN